MITANYNELQKQYLENAVKLWDFKESKDLTVYGLSTWLNSSPEDVEKWLGGFAEIPQNKLNSIYEN